VFERAVMRLPNDQGTDLHAHEPGFEIHVGQISLKQISSTASVEIRHFDTTVKIKSSLCLTKHNAIKAY
jgi:hypothetical protein